MANIMAASEGDLANPGDAQDIRRTGCTKWNASRDNQAFPYPGKFVLDCRGAGLVDHIAEILNVLGEDALYAPSNGKASRRGGFFR